MALQTRYLFTASMDVEPAQEKLFNEVYDTEHVPLLLKVPGVIAVARLKKTTLTMIIGGGKEKIGGGRRPRAGPPLPQDPPPRPLPAHPAVARGRPVPARARPARGQRARPHAAAAGAGSRPHVNA